MALAFTKPVQANKHLMDWHDFMQAFKSQQDIPQDTKIEYYPMCRDKSVLPSV